jgi:alanine racemase
MSVSVGIDLGTTFSAVAYIDPKTKLPQIIPNGEGSKLTPSVIQFLDGEVIFGSEAEDAYNAGEEDCVATFKREMGETKPYCYIGGKPYTSEDLSAMLAWWRRCPDVEMEGIFTHFCVSDTDPIFTAQQNERFAEALAAVRQAGFRPIAHAAASTAMLNPALQYDMVRPGIVLYGSCVPELAKELTWAQTLVTRPIRLQWIAKGDTVGYGRTFTAGRDTLVMTLPIGYGDGYPRILGNRASVLVRGKRAPLIGRVCMDMAMADVTDIPDVDLDDEVVLLGAQGDERITPDELAELANTIPYEIMLGFAVRIPVEVVD